MRYRSTMPRVNVGLQSYDYVSRKLGAMFDWREHDSAGYLIVV